MSFAFAQLPPEIQILVLHRLDSQTERLNFRLVSSAANTLVLEPCFWPVLALLARPHHTTFSNNAAGQPHRPLSLAAALLQHHSDSFLRLRSQQPLDDGLSSSSSLTIAANLPNSSSHTAAGATARAEGGPMITASSSSLSPQSLAASMTTDPKKKSTTEACKSKEDSFLAFVSTLAKRSRSVEGVQELSIEGWKSEASLDQLLRLLILHPFEHLQRLNLHTNALSGLPTLHNVPNAPEASLASASLHICSKLTILDLKNCQQLHDLSGFYSWMPNLEEINLEGCLELVHIAPSPPDLKSAMTATSKAGGSESSWPPLPSSSPQQQPLHSLRKLNLTHTKVGDEDLIWLLEQCPQLQELRLDQCYSLTPESISAIAGRGRPLHPQPEPAAAAAGVQLPSFHATATTAAMATTISANPAGGDPDLQDSSLQTSHTGSRLAASSSSDPQLALLSLNNCYDLTDESIRSLVGCRHLDLLLIRGLRTVREDTLEWLHSQGVPLRKALSPLGKWRHWHTV
ncbi:hypothetical protein EMPS_00881 [Entomortierella parvispora]|uniref:F-box domain-containing protein n=1 Tax=Entomortierella parvispora TaxID=205924 RepID=A0A9P3H1T8_9FUNG|nr:hypothetical protein EMPS_00881 [Entomortierella parvispora]